MSEEASHVIDTLIANAPTGGACLVIVLLFLRRQKEMAVEFKETLSEILAAHQQVLDKILEEQKDK